MFIIPVGSRVDWKHPPVITLLLILVNCGVFFFLQSGDVADDNKALRYYFTTDLPSLELPRYVTHLEKNSDFEQSSQFKVLLAEEDSSAVIWMEQDAKFMRELRAGRIIVEQDTEFAAWSAQRKQYESMASFTSRYVFRVEAPSLLTAFTAAFMHGNFSHLFGNMMVLFLVGFLVESVIGKTPFLLIYIASAFSATYMYMLTAATGSVLGASGAIAGVMGLYTVIFGLRKIDFFYSLGFYFDYVRAPAIALLPLWLGNELFQFYNNHGSNVAYMAHFGGLLCGALLGAIYRWRRPHLLNQHYKKVDAKENEEKVYQQGMDYLSKMEFQKSYDVFKGLQEKHPNDVNLMRLCYRTAKHNPAGEEYHRSAIRLLTLAEMDEATSEQTHTIFQEYLDCAKPAPRLRPDIVAVLAQRFANIGQCEDAENLTKLLQHSAPDHARVPTVLLSLARGHYRAQRKERFKEILQTLIQKFPHSQEAATAADMLRVG